MKTAKKVLALLLSVLMVFTMVSSSVVAVAETTPAEKTQIEDVENSMSNTFDSIKGIIEGVHNLVGGIMSVLGKECVFCDEIHGKTEDTEEPTEPETPPSEPEVPVEPEEPTEPETPVEPEEPTEPEEPKEDEPTEDKIDNAFDSIGGLFDSIHNLVGSILAIFGKECPFCDEVHGKDEPNMPEEPDIPEVPDEPVEPDVPDTPVVPDEPEEEIEPVTGTMESVDVYSITALTINVLENKVVINVSAPENCAVIVRFIDENLYFSQERLINKKYINDGDLYASHVVPGGCDMEDIYATVNGQLPECFVAEAILIDANGDPLCEPFISIEHTRRYEEFAQKTIYSFDDNDMVLNFDESVDNNFGVLADEVVSVTATDIYYDEINDLYYITDPSTELELGDKIYIADDSNEYLICIENVEEIGGCIVVTPAVASDDEYGFQLSDFYKFLKVDMEYVAYTEPQVNTYAARNSRTITDVYIDKEANPSLNLELIHFETTHFEATGEVNGQIAASLFIMYDLVLFGEDYFECNFTFSTDLSARLSVHAKWGSDNDEELKEYLKNKKEKKELKLGKVSIPFGVTGLSAFADIKTCIEWKINAGIELNGSIKTTQGYKYNTYAGKQKVDQKSSTWSVEAKGYAELKFGPKPSVGVDFLGGVVAVKLEAFFGAKVQGEVVVPVVQGGTEKHSCYLCLEGELKGVVSVDVKLEYEITDNFKGTPIDWNIVNIEKKVFDFYVSLLNAADSMFGGHVKAGRGKCPNKEYRISFTTKDSNDQMVTVNVKVFSGSSTLRGEISSDDIIYLPPGNYTASATIDNTGCSKSFNITEGSKNVTLKPNNVNSNVNGSVLDVETRNPISGATVSVYEYSTLVASDTSDANGLYNIPLEEGTYSIVISKEEYVTATQYFTLRDGESKYLDALLMAQEDEDSIMGGIYGTIKDAVTGRAVPDVDIKISRGWGNESTTNTYVAEKVTNDQGVYSCKKWSLFGVDFGLEAGNYTVIISKEGYITTSFNVTIAPGMDLEFNSTITPVGAENVYHIVLTWGSTPSDLDSHMNATYNGSRDHIFYSRKNGYKANLDVDDTTSYGPETITIPNITEYDGRVFYSVHDYSNRGSTSSNRLSMSGATVKVYKGGELLETFYAPTGVGGTVWNVFYIDSYSNVVPVNSYLYINSPEMVYGSAS